MQPKSYKDPKIAMLNIELELKAEKENAEVRIDNVEVSKFFVFLFHLSILEDLLSFFSPFQKKNVWVLFFNVDFKLHLVCPKLQNVYISIYFFFFI